MEDYLSIANSSFIYVLGIIIVTFVMIQSFIFFRRAWKEGLKIGLSKETMMNAVKSSAIFSIVPSLPIIISLIAMAPVLGLPFPWIRLSVVGSAPYELLSANVGAQSMGIKGLGGAAIMTILTYIIKRFEIKWLNNFALAISMVGAMALAILYSNI